MKNIAAGGGFIYLVPEMFSRATGDTAIFGCLRRMRFAIGGFFLRPRGKRLDKSHVSSNRDSIRIVESVLITVDNNYIFFFVPMFQLLMVVTCVFRINILW